MESVRFEPSKEIPLARLDEIIRRGEEAAFRALILDLLDEPNGYLADLAERLRAGEVREDPESPARDRLLAVRHLIAALRQYPPRPSAHAPREPESRPAIGEADFWRMLEAVASPGSDLGTEALASALDKIANGAPEEREMGIREIGQEMARAIGPGKG